MKEKGVYIKGKRGGKRPIKKGCIEMLVLRGKEGGGVRRFFGERKPSNQIERGGGTKK